jgi:phospholipase C
MMENRSFDHMLGSLKAANARSVMPPDLKQPGCEKKSGEGAGAGGFLRAVAADPDHHFPAVVADFGGDPNRVANMQGFVKSYFNQQRDVGHSQKIMYYFAQDKLPVLTTLALEFAVFNRWFASIPGPTICNRAFAHYGTSFGRVDMNLIYISEPFKSIYDRLIGATPKHTSKLSYYDTTSSTMEVTNLLEHQPQTGE